MKKLVLMVTMLTTMTIAFSQTKSQKINYRVGVMTSLPLDIYDGSYRVGIGSVFMEGSSVLVKSKKVTETFNAGYVRLTSTEGTFTQIPVLAGLRYKVNEVLYFGASGGINIFTDQNHGHTQFMFSPYVGVQSRKISVDARYINSSNRGKETDYKTLSLVFSYTL